MRNSLFQFEHEYLVEKTIRKNARSETTRKQPEIQKTRIPTAGGLSF